MVSAWTASLYDGNEAAERAPIDGPEAHLRAWLGVVLHHVQRYVARHAHRMLDASGTLDDVHVSLREALATVAGEAPDTDHALGAGWPSREASDEALQAERAALDDALAQSTVPELPILELRDRASLTDAETAVLLAAAAPALSVDVARLYSFAWADFAVKRPTVGFLCELLAEEPGDELRLMSLFAPEGRLVRAGLVTLDPGETWGHACPLLHRMVAVPDAALTFLRGEAPAPPDRVAPTDALTADDVVLADGLLDRVRSLVTRTLLRGAAGPRPWLVGPRGSGRRTALASVVAERQLGLLTVDVATLPREPDALAGALTAVRRHALLTSSAVLLRLDDLADDDEGLDLVAAPLRAALTAWDTQPVALTSRRETAKLRALVDRAYAIRFPAPDGATQRRTWASAFERAGQAADPEVGATMSRRMLVPAGRIFDAVARATEHRRAEGRRRTDTTSLTERDVSAALRQATAHGLGQVADPMATPLTWDDVVLPEDVSNQCRDILDHARFREQVYDAWGFRKRAAYGHGLSCLFTGPPGTGKTMMAGVLARELDREIYRVDLSRVVSKWIGETEKNLARAFDEAEEAQVVLLFDEADSLFGKRTTGSSAQDRFGNMEVNYLLQRMEAFDGVTILTTNHEANMDPALRRRLRFRVHFPMPEAADRARLWQCLMPKAALVADDIDWQLLGEDFPLSGACIRNAMVRAAFRAASDGRPIDHEDLHEAAVSEARSMGLAVRDDLRRGF